MKGSVTVVVGGARGLRFKDPECLTREKKMWSQPIVSVTVCSRLVQTSFKVKVKIRTSYTQENVLGLISHLYDVERIASSQH